MKMGGEILLWGLGYLAPSLLLVKLDYLPQLFYPVYKQQLEKKFTSIDKQSVWVLSYILTYGLVQKVCIWYDILIQEKGRSVGNFS